MMTHYKQIAVSLTVFTMISRLLAVMIDLSHRDWHEVGQNGAIMTLTGAVLFLVLTKQDAE